MMRRVNRVKLITPLHLEILTQILLQRILHRFEHVVKHALASRVRLVIITALKNTGPQ